MLKSKESTVQQITEIEGLANAFMAEFNAKKKLEKKITKQEKPEKKEPAPKKALTEQEIVSKTLATVANFALMSTLKDQDSTFVDCDGAQAVLSALSGLVKKTNCFVPSEKKFAFVEEFTNLMNEKYQNLGQKLSSLVDNTEMSTRYDIYVEEAEEDEPYVHQQSKKDKKKAKKSAKAEDQPAEKVVESPVKQEEKVVELDEAHPITIYEKEPEVEDE